MKDKKSMVLPTLERLVTLEANKRWPLSKQKKEYIQRMAFIAGAEYYKYLHELTSLPSTLKEFKN